MTDIKKDHSIGAGTGAVGGAMTGAAVGSAAGPIGTVVGAVAGAVLGAKAGDAIAEKVNPTEYNDYFQKNYASAPYYSAGREWSDYQPAYQYGYSTYDKYHGQTFDQAEAALEHDWNSAKANSRLAWAEAKGAVRDGWNRIQAETAPR